ncbi:MAG: zinc ribbon domain-containing protein [bacterium]|nr:zinc ribbon domain-containing protein [bacterium]
MPIYEFQCLKCHKIFERLILSKHDITEVVCPKCKSNQTRRLLSRFGLGGNSSGESKASGSSSASCSTCSGGDCSSCK